MHVWTMLVVIIAWVFFRAASITAGWQYLSAMFGFGASGFIGPDLINTVKNTYVILILSCIGATPFLSTTMKRLREKGLPWVEDVWLLLLFVLSILEVVSSTYNPFIYFNF